MKIRTSKKKLYDAAAARKKEVAKAAFDEFCKVLAEHIAQERWKRQLKLRLEGTKALKA